jgi:uncharacterized phage-associated protein
MKNEEKQYNASSLDVAEYILQQKGPVSPLKLQKLVYYAQAWSLALDEEPIFDESIEAWKNGPVVRSLLENTRNQDYVTSIYSGNPSQIDEDLQDTITAVLICYGQKSGDILQHLTHNEDPWIDARNDAQANKISSIDVKEKKVISQESMKEYYSSLDDIV